MTRVDEDGEQVQQASMLQTFSLFSDREILLYFVGILVNFFGKYGSEFKTLFKNVFAEYGK